MFFNPKSRFTDPYKYFFDYLPWLDAKYILQFIYIYIYTLLALTIQNVRMKSKLKKV